MSTDPHNADHQDVDEPTGVETTGHEWDGIKELNNPLPRWWLIVFYATIVWAFGYFIFMPSFPGLDGLRDHSERKNVEVALAELREERAALGQRLLTTNSLEGIEQDPELFEFAMAAGQSAFGDNCATCHGVGGRGFPGYPSLSDDVWLWGGTLGDIRDTITHGIRASSPQTRMSQMPAFGAQGLLTPAQISDLVTYVVHLREGDQNLEVVARAKPIYDLQCAACHGTGGEGVRMFGAPNLIDAEWLYGDTREEIRQQIYDGRNGVMPNWGERLDDATIVSLAVYVHALGGGEQAPVTGADGQ